MMIWNFKFMTELVGGNFDVLSDDLWSHEIAD
jgi:hypothetical protein